MWHKLYSSQAQGRADKSRKDYQQALLIAATLARDTPMELIDAWEEAPTGLQRALKPHRLRFARELVAIAPEAEEVLQEIWRM